MASDTVLNLAYDATQATLIQRECQQEEVWRKHKTSERTNPETQNKSLTRNAG